MSAPADPPSPGVSAAMGGYWPAFSGAHADDKFLTYYAIQPDKSIEATSYSRADVLLMAQRAAGALRAAGVGKGECVVHFFSANSVADLAFRLGSVMVGAVPVTINWQADTRERVVYKVRVTRAKVVLADAGVGADFREAIGAAFPGVAVLDPAAMTTAGGAAAAFAPLAAEEWESSLGLADTRMVIFTSGTTGEPKGVRTAYSAYECNRASFEALLLMAPGARDADTPSAFVLVNPSHHTNTSAVGDWCLRRPGAEMHLVERYSTLHWATLTNVALAEPDAAKRRVIAPMVARHFDFLDSLAGAGKLPPQVGGPERLRQALARTDVLIGSAPVGPTTVERMQRLAGALPHVRFGSTETTLQVLGTPLTQSPEERLAAFQAGWSHVDPVSGAPCRGFFIGRDHAPLTEAMVVRSLTVGADGYMEQVGEGEGGHLVCRGDNVMQGYVGDADGALTAAAIHEGGWYTKFGDVCFWLKDASDGGTNLYWQSRDSHMLIRGGSNYAYEQANGELGEFISKQYALGSATPADAAPGAGDFVVAVVGLKLQSEHEDDCVATIELVGERAQSKQAEIAETIKAHAKKNCTKGAVPDHVRFAPVPKSFKGAILYNDLKKDAQAEFGKGFE